MKPTKIVEYVIITCHPLLDCPKRGIAMWGVQCNVVDSLQQAFKCRIQLKLFFNGLAGRQIEKEFFIGKSCAAQFDRYFRSFVV
ncbi:hypothetical protein XM53_16450 [Roseovarius atlanticus]|uniref:Uncharacterized protein n=1 Tax=Roseovarius atlanticus TaxID=1641875 RepID=A0A0T5NRH9_9RHOB|nr:hypothetical protein XM53_16450 [Roseovarius atlanticus]